eukprot:1159557-Pelagomonas_calceolata.AAC.15
MVRCLVTECGMLPCDDFTTSAGLGGLHPRFRCSALFGKTMRCAWTAMWCVVWWQNYGARCLVMECGGWSTVTPRCVSDDDDISRGTPCYEAKRLPPANPLL